MSKLIAVREYIVPTAIGTMVVKDELIESFDVEDIVRGKSISMARAIQFLNLGKSINANAVLPEGAIPSVFVGNEEEL